MKIRLIYKEIIKNKLRHFSYLLCLIMICITSLFLFCIDNVIDDAMYKKEIERYHGFDFSLTLSDQSDGRFYNTKRIYEIEGFDEDIIDIASLIEAQAYADDKLVRLYSSTMMDLNKIIDYKIDNNSILISKNLANHITGDTITINIFNYTHDFKYKVCDDPFFYEESIFIPKDILFNILNINIKNIEYYNNITYFKVSKSANIDKWKDLLLSVYEGYNLNLKTNDLINYDSIEAQTNMFSVVSKIIFVLVLVILSIILITLIKKMVFSFKKTKDIIILLGGTLKDSIIILLIKYFILLSISFIISLLFISPLLNIIGKIIYIGYTYDSLVKNYILCFICLLLIIEGIIIFSALSIDKALSKYKYSLKKSLITTLVSIIALIILFMLSDYKIVYIIIIPLIFYITINLITLTIDLIGNKYNKKTVFKLYFFKQLSKNNLYRSSIAIIGCIFLTFILLFTLKTSADNRVNEDFNNINYSHYITSISGEIEVNNEYINASIHSDVTNTTDKSFRIVYEANKKDINKIVKYDGYKELPDNYIILPIYCNKVQGIELGDTMTLELDNQKQEFIVSGFMNIITIHMAVIGDYYSESLYGYICNSEPTVEGNGIYFIISMESSKENISNLISSAILFIEIISYILIFLLVIIIINNYVIIFEENKQEYKRMKLLGMSIKDMNIQLFKEFILISSISIIISIPFGILLTNSSCELLILFKEYFKIYKFNPIDILFSVGLALFSYFISVIYMMLKMKDIELY